jgi:TctA family transporter
MDALSNLALGLSVAMTMQNLAYAFVGALLGTLVGVLPGLGPLATMAMLLPAIYTLDATAALIMLAGIYYGAQYGGSTTAILINVPGESSAVVTAIDGYEMARRGRAGSALAVAALGSFFAGCVGTLVIAVLAKPLSSFALEFGAREYLALLVFGLIASVALASGSLIKAICMIVLGLVLGQIDTDVISGTPRFTFGIDELSDGIDFVVLAMGLFGLGEIIANLGEPEEKREVFTRNVTGLWPTRADFKVAAPAVLRGTALGSCLGVLPGAGAVLSSFAAYALEKKLAGETGTFGKGDIRGVAGPESANNAAAQTSFIPMLSLGLPSGAVMALMIGAMTIKGIAPGPQVMNSNPSLFWGFIASMWVGNLMLVILNLPLIGIWIRLLTVPYRLLFPAILCFCCIGLYSLSNSNFDIYVAVVFGFAGYIFRKLNCEPAPLLLGFVLGPMIEENLRRALLLSGGDWSTFVSTPLSAGLLLAAIALISISAIPAILKGRRLRVPSDTQSH